MPLGCLISAALYAGPGDTPLRAEQDEASQTIKIYRAQGQGSDRHESMSGAMPVPTCIRSWRPMAAGVMTEYRPPHHLHQTGIFWGFKYINNRDFFMKWEGENYRRVSAKVVRATGPRVQWQTVYDLLDESGKTVLTETQNWSMQNSGDKYILDLDWHGEARTDIVFGQIYVGGLFIRIPWHPGDRAEAVNANGQRDKDTEQQHANWIDVGHSGGRARTTWPTSPCSITRIIPAFPLRGGSTASTASVRTRRRPRIGSRRERQETIATASSHTAARSIPLRCHAPGRSFRHRR